MRSPASLCRGAGLLARGTAMGWDASTHQRLWCDHLNWPVLTWTVQVRSSPILGHPSIYSSSMLYHIVSWRDNYDLYQTLLAELLAQQARHDPLLIQTAFSK